MSIILIALAIADVLTTRHFLSLGIREANPLMRAGFERFGFWPTSTVKLALTALLAWWGHGNFWAMAAMCTLQGAIVGWNLYLIWRSDRA